MEIGGNEDRHVAISDIPRIDNKKERPTIRYGPRPPPFLRYSGHLSQNTPGECGSSRKTADSPILTNWAVSRVAPGTKITPSLGDHGNQSTGDFRAVAANDQTPPRSRKYGLPLSTVRQSATSSTTKKFTDPNAVQSMPRPYDSRGSLVSSTIRPSRVTVNSATPSTSFTSSLGPTYLQNKPYQRPRPTIGDTDVSQRMSTWTRPQMDQPEPETKTHSPLSTPSPRAHTQRYRPRLKISVPPINNSNDRAAETGYERDIRVSVLREPLGPATPSSSRYSTLQEPSPGSVTSPEDEGSNASTLEGQPRYSWMVGFTGTPTVMHVPSESTLMSTRKGKLIPQSNTPSSEYKRALYREQAGSFGLTFMRQGSLSGFEDNSSARARMARCTSH